MIEYVNLSCWVILIMWSDSHARCLWHCYFFIFLFNPFHKSYHAVHSSCHFTLSRAFHTHSWTSDHMSSCSTWGFIWYISYIMAIVSSYVICVIYLHSKLCYIKCDFIMQLGHLSTSSTWILVRLVVEMRKMLHPPHIDLKPSFFQLFKHDIMVHDN